MTLFNEHRALTYWRHRLFTGNPTFLTREKKMFRWKVEGIIGKNKLLVPSKRKTVHHNEAKKGILVRTGGKGNTKRALSSGDERGTMSDRLGRGK